MANSLEMGCEAEILGESTGKEVFVLPPLPVTVNHEVKLKIIPVSFVHRGGLGPS